METNTNSGTNTGIIWIRAGRVIDPATGLDGVRDLWIRDGKIEKICMPEEWREGQEKGQGENPDGAESGCRVIDARGCYVMPGLIDLHVHLRDPGQEYKEDIETGGRAAARGGFTTICCMANTSPAADSPETIAYIREKAARVSPVQVIPVGAVTKGLAGEELTDMAAINMNKEQFEQMMNGDKPVLVDFWAPWCGYCRRIGPAYEKIAEEYSDRLVVAKINIDEEPQIAETEQVEVIPTLILYKNGKKVDSVVNPGSKAAIDQFIQEALEK